MYQDYYGGDNTRIISYGKRDAGENITMATFFGNMEGGVRTKRSIDAGHDEDDLLVTATFKIHDNFDEKEKLENKEEKILSKTKSDKKSSVAARPPPVYHDTADSFSFSEEVFDPSNVEVCMNVTHVIAGVAALLILQLVFIFVWTHFLQRRNKKKIGLPTM